MVLNYLKINGNLNGNGQEYIYMAWGQTIVGTQRTIAGAVTIGERKVTTAKLRDANVTTAKILDANVTTAKINLISTSGTPGATIKGTSGQTDGYLQLNCSQNSHGVKIQSPAHSAGQSYTLTLPQSITNGYFLKTDGSGNLSFAEVNSYAAWQSSIVTAATLSAVVGYGYWIDTTSNACTITLPASANVGDQIIFVDYARTWATNAVTINQNSLNFQGFTSPNPVYDTIGQTLNIVYSGATQGWVKETMQLLMKHLKH